MSSLLRGPQPFGVHFDVPVTISRPTDAGHANGNKNLTAPSSFLNGNHSRNYSHSATRDPRSYQKPASSHGYPSSDYTNPQPQQRRHRSPPIYLQEPTPQWARRQQPQQSSQARQSHYQQQKAHSVIQPPVAANTPTRGTMSLDTLNAKFFRLSMEDLVHDHELTSFLNEHSYSQFSCTWLREIFI